MPISQLWQSLRCTTPFKKLQTRPPAIKSQKDRTMSETTESASSEGQTTTTSPDFTKDLSTMHTEHTIILSILDQGMPRHYTRFCLAFRLGESPAAEAISGLEAFFRRTFQAQPWLAGYACPVRGDSSPKHKLEIRFSQRDVEKFPIKVQQLPEDKFPMTYDELCELAMPPSKIPRDLVSSCPDRRPDTEPAPILDVTVNIIRGGLLIAIFLHHGVTDGASMGTIISGRLCRDITEIVPITAIDLAEKAHAETQIRLPLSSLAPNQSIGTHLEYKPALRAMGLNPQSPARTPTPSEVKSQIFHFSDHTLRTLKADLNSLLLKSSTTPQIPWITTHDALQSLLWQYLTRARIPSLDPASLPETSTLLIPVNIRKRITPPLSPDYLGGAVVLAPATFPLAFLLPPTITKPDTLTETEELHDPSAHIVEAHEKFHLLNTAITIHTAIARCNDSYLREVLALTQQEHSVREMVDLNIDTAGGLDLCITSWAVLPCFEEACFGEASVGEGGAGGGGARCRGSSDLGMGLGPPDFVRKPWSRDAGGCIILPRDARSRRKGGLEVLVQLKTGDMERLRADAGFMAWVDGVVD